MARPSFRFRPPSFPLDDPALRWVLIRAFGPPEAAAPDPPEPGRAIEQAQALSLAARLGVRVGRERLTLEIGAEATREILAASRVATARALQLEGVRQRVTGVARGLGIPLVLLKFAALEAAGRLLPGSRPASDLDLLVPGAEARRLIAALRSDGFVPGDEPEQEHQWPALFHQGVALELHRHLPGVEVTGASGFVTAEDLVEAGALVPVTRGVFRPADAVLGAHLLAHGLAQHGLTPEAYPALRAFADLSDLGLGTAGDGPWHEIRRLLPTALTAEEIDAARRLLLVLEAGELDWLGPDSAARTLLDHLLAGTFDSDYRSALKLRLFSPPLSERNRGRAFADFLRRTVWLSDAQIDAIYGPPRSRLGYHARRWWRPFDLVGRSFRALKSVVRRGRGAAERPSER